jgi:hypothetical protein
MTTEPTPPPPPPRPRFQFLKLLPAFGLAVLGVLVFAFWYLVKCDGSWGGIPLEAKGLADLSGVRKRLQADVTYLQSLGPRNSENDTAYAQLQSCAEWIVQQWQAQGYVVRRRQFMVKGKTYANLEVELPGATLPWQLVIVSAQYDTLPGSPGANNNASGVAALFRLSELLKGQRLDRTVRLVEFVNEEDPFFGTDQMGSRIYAKVCRELDEDIRAMLSLDSIGIYKHTPGSQRLPWPFSLFYPDRGDFLAFIANLPSRHCVTVATRGFHKGSSFPIAAGVAPEWVAGVTWSDHSSFWKFGYPGVQVTDSGAFRSASHTTKEDTLDKIDFAALARVTLGIYGATLELANRQNDPGLQNLPAQWLFLNGVIVLLAGLLAGLPLWLAILCGASAANYKAWRVAHATLIAQGLLMLIIGLALPRIALGQQAIWIAVWSLTAAGYGFVFAMTVGAWTGRRGLSPRPWGLNTVLFIGHVVGAAGSLVAVGLLCYGALKAL